MIHDVLENSAMYESLNPNFKMVFEYLRTTDFDNMQPCQYKLNDDVLVIVTSTKGRHKEEAQVEVHNEYIDIQMPLDKTETIGWISRRNLKKMVSEAYAKEDVAFYNDTPADYVTVLPHEFVVFFPTDGHKPLLLDDNIKKVVVKVRK